MLLDLMPIFSIHADCPTEISHFVSPFQRKFDYLPSIPPNKGIYTETKTSVLTIREFVVFPELNTNLKVFMIVNSLFIQSVSGMFMYLHKPLFRKLYQS